MTRNYTYVTERMPAVALQRAQADRDALQARIAALQGDFQERRSTAPASQARRLAHEEQEALTQLRTDLAALDAQVRYLGEQPGEQPVSAREHMRSDGGGVQLIGPEQRDGFSQWTRATFPREFDGEASAERELSLGLSLRGLITGNWRGAELERRALGEATAGAGGVTVPTPLAASIIDKARNATRVLQAGARIIPMESQTLKVPRLLTEPTGSTAWRSEAAAISEQNMTFDAVTFTAQSMAFYVRASRELIEDATAGGGVEAEIRRAFAAEIALELDRVALFGTGTAPQPRGLLNTSGVTSTAHGANGSAISALKWDFLTDAVATVRSNNFEPNAVIDAPRTEQGLAKLVDTTGQYIPAPGYLAQLPRYPTAQVPINITTGTSNDTSYTFVGQWDQLWIGMRTEFVIDVLRERFADTGQYAFLCWVRADVQVAQPAAFAIDTGVRG